MLLLLSGSANAQSSTNELPPEEQKPAPKQGLIVPVSVMGGILAGGAIKAGDIAPNASDNPNAAVGGFDVALEVGSLVLDHIYGGFILGGTFFASPQSSTANVSSLLFGTEFGYLTNPKGVGGFFAAGIGYRATYVSDSLGNSNKFDGPDALFTIGLHLRLASYVRLMPRVDISVGPTSGADAHAFFVFGVSAWFNADVYPSHKRTGL